jgi:TRAP-type mannitol/chloroaromatic compound transport system permease large subunit
MKFRPKPLNKKSMADSAEQAEHAISALMRFVVSLIIPLWALAMLVLGVEYRSLWWLGCGLVVGAIGLLFMVGNPLARPLLDERESWRPLSPPKSPSDSPQA